MPWKETGVLEERMRFVVDYRSGEYSVSELCRRHGVSRPTGYKWLERFCAEGAAGLLDRSSAPHGHPNAVGLELEALVLSARGSHPHWGPKKLLSWLSSRHPGLRFPAASTVGELLHRHGLSVARKRRRRVPAQSAPFLEADAGGPNTVWSADFKGWFFTGDGVKVSPLTISDASSRYLIRCQGLRGCDFAPVQRVFEASFRECGLPLAIRTDNGPPFATRGIAGLSRLSVWWIKLGVKPERISAGHPEENGRHERMHRTLKAETANPPGSSFRSQQQAFDRFRAEYNQTRPHEALGQVPPASVYVPSPRSYPCRVGPFVYGSDTLVRKVDCTGVFYWQGRKVFLGEALSGERIGLAPIDDGEYRIVLGDYEVGRFDERSLRVFGV